MNHHPDKNLQPPTQAEQLNIGGISPETHERLKKSSEPPLEKIMRLSNRDGDDEQCAERLRNAAALELVNLKSQKLRRLFRGILEMVSGKLPERTITKKVRHGDQMPAIRERLASIKGPYSETQHHIPQEHELKHLQVAQAALSPTPQQQAQAFIDRILENYRDTKNPSFHINTDFNPHQLVDGTFLVDLISDITSRLYNNLPYGHAYPKPVVDINPQGFITIIK